MPRNHSCLSIAIALFILFTGIIPNAAEVYDQQALAGSL